MLSDIFGLKIDYARDSFSNQDNTTSLSFNTYQNRYGFQGVVNLGKLLRFDSFSKRIGVLSHGGLQYSQFYVNDGINKGIAENNVGLMFGISPQFYVSKKTVLTFDFTTINNFRQHLNWDGSTAISKDNLSGRLYNFSVGLTYYLGKKMEHADWVNSTDHKLKVFSDSIAHKRIDVIESLLNDMDKDGMPDYLDRENNTPGGVAVDTRGRFLDTNNNGVPDELEKNKEKVSSDVLIDKVMSVENELIERGLVIVFFDSNSIVPSNSSTNNLYILLHYMQHNPEVKPRLKGYTDKTGNESSNIQLSKLRAQSVFDFLVVNKVSSYRISIEGNGVDSNFSNDSKVNFNMARRVSIQIY